jgi:hypothetical protein
MNSIRNIAKSMIKEMQTPKNQCDEETARYFQRLAVIYYADFLRHSPERPEGMNLQCLEECKLFADRAVSYGASQKQIEESFDRLRRFWIPRLKDVLL